MRDKVAEVDIDELPVPETERVGVTDEEKVDRSEADADAVLLGERVVVDVNEGVGDLDPVPDPVRLIVVRLIWLPLADCVGLREYDGVQEPDGVGVGVPGDSV